MTPQILEECTQLAFQNKITFPETVKRLAHDGVKRRRTVYTGRNGDFHVEYFPAGK